MKTYFYILFYFFFSFGLISQELSYQCDTCQDIYIDYYNTNLSTPPFKIDSNHPLFRNKEITKTSLHDLASIAGHDSNLESLNFLYDYSSQYFDDSTFKGLFYLQKSFSKWHKGQVDSAIYYEYQSINILTKQKSRYTYIAYFSLAQTHSSIDSNALALRYGIQSYELIKDKFITRNDSTRYTSICYFLYNEYLKDKELKNLSEQYFDRAVEMSKITKDYANQVLLNNVIILKLIESNERDSAFNTCLRNIELINQSQLHYYLEYSYLIAGKILYLQNNYTEANLYFDSIINHNKASVSNALVAYQFKILTSEKENLRENLVKLLNFKDSLNSIESKKHTALLTTKYETKRIQKENEILQKENLLKEQQITIRNISIITIIVIMLAFLYWIMERRKRKQLETENKLLVIGQKLLRTQMNPHFIFNSLSAIQNVISNGDNLKAEKELGSFATLMRQILDSSRAELIEIDSEIALISTFLKIHKTILGDSFDYKVNIKNNLDNHDILIPPMLIQPFVENAIQYGELIDNKNFIELNLSIKEDRFIYEVINNGKWVDKSKKKQSHSINITKERILVLNKNRKDYIHFFIQKTPKVKVTFSFKIN